MRNSENRPTRLGLIRIFCLCVVWLILGTNVSATEASLAPKRTPQISNVEILTPLVARYDRFEVRFDLATNAPYPDLPYDPKPPSGLQPGMGITVDALFSPDDWKTVIRQPAFRYQHYLNDRGNGSGYLVPNGPPRWAVRFAPPKAGTWQLRITAKDASGETTFPQDNALSFIVQDEPVATADPALSNPNSARGFIRVSARDPRYFEFDDGSYFSGLGLNIQFREIGILEETFGFLSRHGVNFVRIWMSMAGINGSHWTSWATRFMPNTSYVPGVALQSKHTYADSDVAFRLDLNNPCIFSDLYQGGIPVKTDSEYELRIRAKWENVEPKTPHGQSGFVAKDAGWLDKDCARQLGDVILGPITGSSDWTTLTARFKIPFGRTWINYLYLALQNAASGTVFIDDVRLIRVDDPYQVNILKEPNANSHLYFDPMRAFTWDQIIKSAEENGIYLKVVADERVEWIKSHTAPDGTMMEQGSDNNFYAKPGTKVRWLEQAWWRYLIARWGYSTAIHSFEYINEGDPYNGNHYEAAAAMAQYFDENDPARHLVTTSFWHSFPNKEFWSHPAYQSIDYADIHAYMATGWGPTASFIHPSRIDLAETGPGASYAVKLPALDNKQYSITPRGLVLQEPGEWTIRFEIKGVDLQAKCAAGTSGSRVRVRWGLSEDGLNEIQSGIVPNSRSDQREGCWAPGGTFDWTELNSQTDREGNLLPPEKRLIVKEGKPVGITLRLDNYGGTGGTFWVRNLRLISPSGRVTPVIGRFDPTPLDQDPAWWTAAYGLLFGANSPVGAKKPLVRGETGFDFVDKQERNREVAKDKRGIWLHQAIWGQINPGGMYDLQWWVPEIYFEKPDSQQIDTLYNHYLTFSNFMKGIPLNNGEYREVGATVSNPMLRAWGQRDDKNGRMHLWLQNLAFTWTNEVQGKAPPPISGTITIPAVPEGDYCLEWWDTFAVEDPIRGRLVIHATDSLTIPLPFPLIEELGLKIRRLLPNDAAPSSTTSGCGE